MCLRRYGPESRFLQKNFVEKRSPRGTASLRRQSVERALVSVRRSFLAHPPFRAAWKQGTSRRVTNRHTKYPRTCGVSSVFD